MKRFILSVVVFFLFIGPAAASSSRVGLAASFGVSKDDINIYRLAVNTPVKSNWLKRISPNLELKAELAYTLWDDHSQKVHGIAIAPVFYYVFKGLHPRIHPYIEGGIGGAWIDDYTINCRNLSTNLQFEDRVGVGIRYGALDVNFRYMHYSNASLKTPNHGIDIFMSTLSWAF